MIKSNQTKQERSEKRQARRDKQRQNNILRARKMHEARLVYESQQNLPLKIENKIKDKAIQLYIGCSGWFYWDWRTIFYPADLPTNKWFDYYGRYFSTVELNAPFYSWPTINTVKTWLKQAKGTQCVYTVKVSELITHIKRFAGTKTLIQDFGLIADLLGERMGCFLFQLPPSYEYTPARLKSIISQLDPKRRNVMEFRHESWWNERVFETFRDTGIIFCSCSGPKLPDDLIKTTEDIYIRFHGTKRWYRHDYTREELAQWATKIRAAKAKRIWVYFNNDYEGHAIRNAQALQDMLS